MRRCLSPTSAIDPPALRPRRRALAWLAAAGIGAASWPGPALARAVSLNGSIGTRAALLIIDGQPRTVSVGAMVDGVRLISVGEGSAEVDVGGRRLVLRIGGAPVSLGAGPAGGATAGLRITLTAGPGGHFTGNGSINGKAMRFMIDTGATAVALSQADADRMGIDHRRGPFVMTATANGPVPASRVTVTSIRVGDVEVANVQALVLPAMMDYVLLGNSFLERFQMQRENDVLRLDKRP